MIQISASVWGRATGRVGELRLAKMAGRSGWKVGVNELGLHSKLDVQQWNWKDYNQAWMNVLFLAAARLMDRKAWSHRWEINGNPLNPNRRTSLVVLWLRICLAMHGTWIQSLVDELRSHKLENLNPRAASTQPTSHSKDPAWCN